MGRPGERAGRLFEQAPQPRGSWRKCLEQGGEHSGGLEQEAGAWGGCVELGCFEEKEKCQFSPTLVNASSEGDFQSPTPFPWLKVNQINQTDRGTLRHRPEPPALCPWAFSLNNISESGAKAPKISNSQQRNWGRWANICPLQCLTPSPTPCLALEGPRVMATPIPQMLCHLLLHSETSGCPGPLGHLTKVRQGESKETRMQT